MPIQFSRTIFLGGITKFIIIFNIDSVLNVIRMIQIKQNIEWLFSTSNMHQFVSQNSR